MSDQPLLKVRNLSKFYGNRIGCSEVSFDLWPGEVLAIVGESGSGKTTLLNCLSTRLMPTTGCVDYHMRDGQYRDYTIWARPNAASSCARTGASCTRTG